VVLNLVSCGTIGRELFKHKVQICGSHADFRVQDIMETQFPMIYDYVCVNNIDFRDKAPEVVSRAVTTAKKAAIFGMPKHCPDHYKIAKDLGYKNVEFFDCGESTVTKVNVNGYHDLCGASDSM